MIYRKNLPNWERTLRVVAGLLMVRGGLAAPGLAWTPAGWIIAASGVLALATGVVGFCPACAMADRRLR